MNPKETRCKLRDRYDHPDVIVPGAPGALGVDALSSFFEEEVRRGVKFRAGETVQIGWYILRFEEDLAGDLVVYEPAFGSMPMKWMPGISNAYRFLVIQKEVCERLGVDPIFPSVVQAGIVSPKFLEKNSEFELERDSPSGNNSGWMFFENEYEGEGEGTYYSLYEIAINASAVIPFLALPPGTIVRRDCERVSIEFLNVNFSSDDDEFLNELVKSKFFC